jgi:PAS domain S-box-containing protein
LLGYTEEELIGQPASILFAEEEEVYRVFQFFREPEKAGVIRPQDTIRNRELTYRTKDGRLFPMLFNASVLADEAGNVTGVVAGARDIIDLKLAEVEIRKEKTFSENIIATIPDPLLVLDKDLTIKKENLSFYKVFGTEHERVIGARITDILGDEDGRLSARLIRLLGTEDNIEHFELHYPSEKRGERIFSITARNIIFAEEELLVIRDITERKRTEEALKQSEEETWRLAQETAIIAEIGRIISSTLNIEEVYERFAEEVRKLIPFDRISIALYYPKEGKFTTAYVSRLKVEGRQKGDDYPFAGSTIEEMMSTRSTVFVQTESMEELQNRFPGLLPTFQAGIRSMLSVPLIARGEVIGGLHFRSKRPKAYTEKDVEVAKSIANQIVGAIANALLFSEHKQDKEALMKAYLELKQTQSQLIQAEKAEVIGRLASGVAHEVKNPLAIIVQGIDYLSANVPLDKANVSLILEYMNNAVMRADNITKGLLSFSRAGEIKKMPQNLNSIIESSLLFVKNLLDKYYIKVIKDFGKDILPLNLDKSRMEQVFLNLFLNAIDAMPGGGQIKVSTYNEEIVEKKVSHRAGETAVIAEIEDTGTGIPADIIDKIFDPFFTTKRDKGGTGLGLPIVRNIVEMHDGEIKIENIIDRSGVRVTVWFKS